MSRIFVISDGHLRHEGAVKWRDGFSTMEEHDDFILANIKKTVGKRDTLYCLGDMAFSKEGLALIQSIICEKKVLIMGNHDAERDGITMEDLLQVYDRVEAHFTKYGVIFSHCPIHPSQLRGGFPNLHGHTHSDDVMDEVTGEKDIRYFNACVEKIGYTPVDLQIIKAHLTSLKDK